MNEKFYLQLQEITHNKALKSEIMSRHTTFKIGGAADYFIAPDSIEEIQKLLKLCNKENVPFYILGNGSNLLVGDNGYRGLIIQIYKNMGRYSISNKSGNKFTVKAEAGIMLSKLASVIADNGLRGFEFASGIPGTLGGAITMNAGAYEGEIKDSVISVKVLDSKGNVKTLTNSELNFGYRSSVIQKENLIVLESVLEFEQGNKDEILEKIREFTCKRKEKQPLEYPSAGSTFKRPEGYFAGKLIMDSGLRGYRVGDIMISEKHCGFVINTGNGNAKQVRQLMSDVDARVYQRFGVHLEPEIKMIGEF